MNARIVFFIFSVFLVFSGCHKKMSAEDTGMTQSDTVSEVRLAGKGFNAPPPNAAPRSDHVLLQNSFNTEQYDYIQENAFREVISNPLSTFSIDVDTASYSNTRRFLESKSLPPVDAVRIEELVNYFSYDYKAPDNGRPLALITEMSDCPWNNEHKLVHIGIKGKDVSSANIPPSNLVFLIDVSGSMQSPEKLPLLKDAFDLMVKKLRPQDRVAITVYAGAAGLVLPSTSGGDRETISRAIRMLEAGGTTAGSAGIRLAYETAMANFIPGGNNRVILATDGDFNVGESSDSEMIRLIEEKRKEGIFLTVLGFGMGNLKDSKMEKIADHGNGNYAYIDSLIEAKKVLVREFASTMLTVAKDVKIQIEFNPAKIRSYRLIGYENRIMAKEDFHDDKKDAGELGAGNSVTALYEVVPTSAGGNAKSGEKLKYQKVKQNPAASASKEIMTLKIRYKLPSENESRLMTLPVEADYEQFDRTSDDFRFSAAVAGFGMLLRNSEYRGNMTYNDLILQAKKSKGKDFEGDRAEFIRLVEIAEILGAKGSR